MTRSPKIISVTNQKGGVGKTTTTVNLGAALAARGYKVAIVDLDPQGNASTGLGIEQGERELTTFDLFTNDNKSLGVFRETGVPNLTISPSTTDLSSADVELAADPRRIWLLSDKLKGESIARSGLDFILIDCPPSLSLLTINALVASGSVLVPLQAEFFALEGLSQLMLSFREIRESANPNLRMEGVVLTMYDRRNRLCHQVEADARENLKELVFKTVIPRNVRLSEAPSFGMPATNYDPTSRGAIAYKALASELLERSKAKEKVGSHE